MLNTGLTKLLKTYCKLYYQWDDTRSKLWAMLEDTTDDMEEDTKEDMVLNGMGCLQEEYRRRSNNVKFSSQSGDQDRRGRIQMRTKSCTRDRNRSRENSVEVTFNFVKPFETTK